jgi:putative ubiquitin-RnfH superfamily antitoxin RatB of RatAB toxin-antitoxin module
MRSRAAPGGCMAGLRVEVVYARASEQHVALVEVEEGMRALDAIEASGFSRASGDRPAQHPARPVRPRDPPDERLRDGDRIEILRPLRRGRWKRGACARGASALAAS